MADLLQSTMSNEDRVMLSSLATHPGFAVLKRMMEEKCQLATDAVIKLDPLTDRYPNKLASLQQTSRAINDFCSSVLRSVDWHLKVSVSAEREAEGVVKVQQMLDQIQKSATQ